MEKKNKKIKIPIFDVTINLYIGNVSDNVEKVAKKYDCYEILNEIDPEAYTVILTKDGEVKFFVFYREDVNDGVIAHEALHLTYHILDIIGIKLSVDSHETQAYLLEYLINKFKKYL